MNDRETADVERYSDDVSRELEFSGVVSRNRAVGRQAAQLDGVLAELDSLNKDHVGDADGLLPGVVQNEGITVRVEARPVSLGANLDIPMRDRTVVVVPAGQRAQ